MASRNVAEYLLDKHQSNKLITAQDTKGLKPFRYGAAIFDFDGTLADSLDVWKRVDDLFFERRGLTYAHDYAEKLSVLGFEEGARYTIDTYGLSDTPQQVCTEWNKLGTELYRTDVELFPSAREYVQLLQAQGIPVALATTNRPEVLAAAAPRLKLDELLPIRVHGSDVAQPTKRDPDIYLECARRLGVEPEDCVVFEDIPTAIQTAQQLDMTTVAVLTCAGQKRIEPLIEAADYVLLDWRVLV